MDDSDMKKHDWRLPSKSSQWHFVVWSVIPMISWFVYLTGVWPGSLSVDSTITWHFSSDRWYDSTHSALYTLHFVIVRLLHDSPGAVAISQIVMLSVAHAHMMKTLSLAGVRLPWLYLATIFAAISPLNGFMVSTLWKDVPHSAMFLLLTSFLLRAVLTGGRFFFNFPNTALFSLVAVMMIFYRPNGFPVVLVGLASLFLVPGMRKPALLFGCATFLSTFAAVKVGMEVFLQPPKHNYWASGKSIPLHLLAAGHERLSLPEDVVSLITRIQPENLHYDCRNSGSLMFRPFVDVFLIHRHAGKLRSAWLDLVKTHPELYLQHVTCGSRFIYSPTPTHTLYHVNHAIRGLEIEPWHYHFGKEGHSQSLQTGLAYLYQRSRKEPLRSIVWWPGTSLWLIGISGLFLLWRWRSVGFVIPAVMVFTHSAVMLLLVPNDQTRYQYPVLLLLVPCLLLLSARLNFVRTKVLNVRKIWIYNGVLIAACIVGLLSINRPWVKTIYEGSRPDGEFLQENRASIDHPARRVFQHDKNHFLEYVSCLEVKERKVLEVNVRSGISVSIDDASFDGGKHLVDLEVGGYLVRVGFALPSKTAGFLPIHSHDGSTLKFFRPRDGQTCRKVSV